MPSVRQPERETPSAGVARLASLSDRGLRATRPAPPPRRRPPTGHDDDMGGRGRSGFERTDTLTLPVIAHRDTRPRPTRRASAGHSRRLHSYAIRDAYGRTAHRPACRPVVRAAVARRPPHSRPRRVAVALSGRRPTPSSLPRALPATASARVCPLSQRRRGVRVHAPHHVPAQRSTLPAGDAPSLVPARGHGRGWRIDIPPFGSVLRCPTP